MRSIWFFIVLFIFCAAESQAAVELSRQGHSPQLISEVYHHEGVPYLAIDDVLPALGMRGYWSPVQHRYRITAPRGKATFFPGGHYLQYNDRFLPLKHRPRFIDGRLRVSEDFIVDQLAELAPYPIFYRNLNPETAVATTDEGPLDKLFAFLLQKKKGTSEPKLRAVAIDPGHGGEETGAIGIGGVKEKAVVLAVAKQLEKQIKMKLGVPIYLSRDDDYYLSADQHLQSARNDNVDAFLLLHAQASFSPESQGIHLYVRPEENEFTASSDDNGETVEKASSMMLALRLSAALREAGFKVVEVAQAPLMPLVRGNLPTVLVELGYLSNTTDLNLLTDTAGQQRLAEALFVGLQAFSADK